LIRGLHLDPHLSNPGRVHFVEHLQDCQNSQLLDVVTHGAAEDHNSVRANLDTQLADAPSCETHDLLFQGVLEVRHAGPKLLGD
jgi:hypothetical protein